MPKAFEGLLRYIILAQSTPIAYHTEGLVETEVMSTVHTKNGHKNQAFDKRHK